MLNIHIKYIAMFFGLLTSTKDTLKKEKVIPFFPLWSFALVAIIVGQHVNTK